jgi:hypothetical protein
VVARFDHLIFLHSLAHKAFQTLQAAHPQFNVLFNCTIIYEKFAKVKQNRALQQNPQKQAKLF